MKFEFLLSLSNIAINATQDDITLSIGDRVLIKQPMLLAYLVDKEGNLVMYDYLKSLMDDDDPSFAHKGLMIYLQESTPIVTEILSKPIEYKCKNCEEIHTADIGIFFPEIKNVYYISSVCLTTDLDYHKLAKENFLKRLFH